MEETNTNQLEQCISWTSGKTEHTYVFPPVGPNLYWEVGEKILQRGLRVPTGDDIVPLLRGAYCDSHFKDAAAEYRSVLQSKGGVYVFNRNIWTSKGAYVIQDPEVDALQQLRGNSEEVQVWDLMQLIEQGSNGRNGVRFSRDGKTRFAPKESYTLGEINPQSLAEDGFVIANFGERGAREISEVAAQFNNKPFLRLMDVDEEFYGILRSPLDYKNKVVSVNTENDRLEICGLRDDGINLRGDLKTSSFGVLSRVI